MSLRPFRLVIVALMTLVAIPHAHAQAADPKPALKPAVAALLRTSTAAYQKMHTYQHTAELLIRAGQDRKVTAYTLALERPNRFAYRSDDAAEAAAVSDGDTFINYKKSDGMYTKIKAPSDFRGVNIVDDVNFEPIGTYIVALMLQGDVLADRVIRHALEQAADVSTVTEDGKRYDTLTAPLTLVQTDEKTLYPPVTLYFDAQTHLLHKAVFEFDAQNGRSRVTEIIENVKVDQPVPPATFHYTPPANAQWLVRFQPQEKGRHGMRGKRAKGSVA